MPQIVLLGDSIFDNGVYTGGGPDVVSQVREFLPSGWEASLLAVDGATTDNIAGQVERLPAEATHLVLSVGGNNALTEASRLGISFFADSRTSSAIALGSFAEISEGFERCYRRLWVRVCGLVCRLASAQFTTGVFLMRPISAWPPLRWRCSTMSS